MDDTSLAVWFLTVMMFTQRELSYVDGISRSCTYVKCYSIVLKGNEAGSQVV